MRSRLAWLATGIGVAGAVVYRALRPGARTAPPTEPDPRAEELRRRIDESRELLEERDEFESAETPVDQAEPVDLEERRRHVHERGRAAIDRMQQSAPEDTG